ncbi:hypothetical protein HELRODRAFT_172705 [Helobdella robusta]|uniref:Endonuclease/exonuclease/phosphatase domain-containing protein n=1 Tax=Helobdella robusta TaxID=6412 RepID=T1F5T8_HELRO|nr:hypothetical protein HELRODRAFT_172705 [Helobdella robusta]ESO04342.1 hypothetical protein HELRODRAFT_172705 [Helobdella robusta]
MLGDLNGHVGADADGYEGVHGGWRYGIQNEEGRRVLELADAQSMVVGNTWFTRGPARLITYKSEDHRSMIDYILVRAKHRRYVRNVKAIPGMLQHSMAVMDVASKEMGRRKKDKFETKKKKKMFPRNNLVTNSYCLKLKKFSTEDDDVDRNRDNTMMKLGLLNVRSLSNKSVVIYDALLHNKIDVMVLTETWHRASNDDSVKSALPPGYGYDDAVREFDPAHGGLIVMVKDVYSLRRLDIPKLTSFECLCVQISMANTPVILMAIYRPGSKGADKLFFDELGHVVEGLIVNNVPLLIAGDFNIHLEDADDLNAKRMEDFFATFDMIRFVHGPTHVKNGTLDFVAATSSYEITDVTVRTPGEFSDHALITCLLLMQKQNFYNK